jgi:hypothetical protein
MKVSAALAALAAGVVGTGPTPVNRDSGVAARRQPAYALRRAALELFGRAL